MYQLTEHEVDTICDRLRKDGVSTRKLEQDLLDHFCCHMEEHMTEHDDFEKAYKEATIAICPNGGKEIEFELFFIMNFNKQLSMKRSIFVVAFLGLFLLSSGIMFKTLHWPGADIVLFCGFASLAVTAVATVLHLVRFLRHSPSSFWFRSISGLTAVFLICMGFMFKFFHWPGANIMYLLGTVTLNVVFLPVFFFHLYKHGFVKNNAHEAA